MTDFDNKELQGQEPQTVQPEPASQPQEQPVQSAPVQEPQQAQPVQEPQQAEPVRPNANPYGQQVPHLTFDPNEGIPYQGDPFQTPEPPQAPVPPQPEPEYQQTGAYEAPPQYGASQYGAPQYGAPQYGAPQYNGGQYQPPQYTQPPQQTYYQPQYNVPPAGYMQKSRMAAGLLGILLGTLGIHNFYLGFTTRGVVQLLVSLIGGVFTCGLATIVVAIWGFVEGVLLLTASPSRMYDGHGVILRD